MSLISSALQRYLNRFFSISEQETRFSKRGFQTTESHKQALLEGAGAAFVRGYNWGLEMEATPALCVRLDKVGAQERGFAYEGAAMALALTDHIWHPMVARWPQLLQQGGATHKYMLHVGYGWAVARLPWLRRRPAAVLAQHPKLEKWLILDGYGFHEGFFYPQRTLAGKVPATLDESEKEVFDQGVGRSLWFISGANVDRVASKINRFSTSRQANLWSGVGLAATYAGGASEQELRRLRQLSGKWEAHMAQGSAFAAQARCLAQNLLPATDIATRVLIGLGATDAASVTELALRKRCQNQDFSVADYGLWRAGVREHLEAGNYPNQVSNNRFGRPTPPNTMCSSSFSR